MCSIGGFIASSPLDADAALKLCQGLLFYGVERGRQSSGIYVGGRILKRAMAATEFVYGEDFKALFAQPISVALTHNRMPTSGGLGDEQAHPFQCGDTIVVHNGGIANAQEVKKRFELEKSSGVDSELFAAAIHQHGLSRLAEITAEMRGTAAIAALHEGALYLARDGSPLEFLRVKLGETDVVVFGSTEDQVLQAIRFGWLLGRCRTTTLPTDQLYPVTAAGLQTSLGRFATKSWSTIHPYSSGWHQSDDEWPTYKQQPRLPLLTAPVIRQPWIGEVLPPNSMGYGWIADYDAVRKVTVHRWNADYAEAQRKKFPNAPVPSSSLVVVDKRGGTSRKNQKKDRNRNRRTSLHTPHR